MEQIVVLDYGSKTFKAGFSYSFPSEEEPRVAIPTIVERTDQPAEPSQHQGSNVRFPVVKGKIHNFEEIEALTSHVLYDKLGWEVGAEGLVIMSEPVLTSRSDREATAQMMFETFNVEGLYVQDQATLSLYALGRITGCVLDVGHGKVDVSVVTEGQLNSSTCRRMEFAGEELTYLLQDLLRSNGVPGGAHDAELLKEMCSSAAESASAFDRAMSSTTHESKVFTLPDGQQITSTTEGMHVTEALFRPELISCHGPGLADLAAECVATHYEGAFRRQVFEGVLVCGGGSAIPGLATRLIKEVKTLLPPSINPALCPVPEYLQADHTCKFAPWVGGAVLSKVLLQQGQFVGKADYDEFGPYAMHRKCC
eukprot:gene4670-14867_t